MFGLLTYLGVIALADSINPTATMLQIYLLSTPNPVKRSATFILGVFVAYFIAGWLLSLGFAKLIENIINYIGSYIHILQLLIGVAIAGGLYRGDLVIVAGRPSMGKTIMGASFAYNIASSEMPTLIFSLEMSAKHINMRYLSSLSGIPTDRLRSGKLQTNEWKSLAASMDILSTLPIFVDDSTEPTALQIRSKVRQTIKKQGKLGLVVVDYLQLMVNSADSNVTLKLGEISRQMKFLARECDVPVVCLSQLSRNVEERANKRPILSDLRQSGQIEENADVVLMVCRDEYYNPVTSDRNIV